MTPLNLQARTTDRGFERLYRRHAADVYRYALAVLRNPDDAEDVTQTTFLNAYRAFQGGERPRAPKNWLIAIAHNVCRQRFRQSARRPNEVEFDEEITAAVPTDDGPSAGDIRRALGHLAFNQRAALVMRELEGRSYAEIAGILELSVGAVETLIFRARRALREQLEEALTCDEAEFAISRQIDGRLPRAEKGRLRAHLRACDDCAAVARSQRAQRSALRGLAGIPLPSSLASFFGGGGGAGAAAAAGAGIAAKVLLVGTTAIVVAGVGYEGVHHRVWQRLVPHGHVAQAEAAKPPARGPVLAAGSVGPETTRIVSDVRPPNRARPHRRLAAPARPVAKPVVVTAAPAPARRAVKRAQPAHATQAPKPLAKSAVKAPPRPAPKPHAAKIVASPPPPPPSPPPASPSPPAQPVSAPVVVEQPKKERRDPHARRRHHREHPPVVVRPKGDDDDPPAATPVAPPPAKAPCKGKRHHEHVTIEARHRLATPPAQVVVPPERHRSEPRHEHRDHGDGGSHHGRRDRRHP